MNANCQKTDMVTFKGSLQCASINGEFIQQATHTKVLGLQIDEGLNFKMQIAHSKGVLTKKWNMLKPFIHAGLDIRTTRKILTTVIIVPKALYNASLWDLNGSISLYPFLKEMLYVPFTQWLY